jgi:hypothetical protein
MIIRTPDRLTTAPAFTRRKKCEKSALRNSLSLDQKRPHKCSAYASPVMGRLTLGGPPSQSLFSAQRCRQERVGDRSR